MKHSINIDRHYALNPVGELVGIISADRSVKYTCVGCGGEMILKQGKVREWHFAHKTLSENCNNESYLHSLTKRRIYNWFKESDRFLIGLKTEFSCSHIDKCILFDRLNPSYCRQDKFQVYDLKLFYNTCEKERTYRNFRADLFLSNSKKNVPPIFIEVCVNHPCSEEKINSNIRIIEIAIKCEEDIDNLIHSTLSENNDHIRFFNFAPKPKVITSCYKELTKFILDSTYRGSCYDVYCKSYHKRNPKSIFEMTIDANSHCLEYSIYQIGMALAYNNRCPVRSCFICKYHQYNDDKYLYEEGDATLPIKCCLYKKLGTKKYCKSTKAVKCSAFRVSKELCYTIEKRIRGRYADIWKKPSNAD